MTEGLRDLQAIRIQEHHWMFEFVFLVSGKLDLVSWRVACYQNRYVRQSISSKPREQGGLVEILYYLGGLYILSKTFKTINACSISHPVYKLSTACSTASFVLIQFLD